MSKSKSSSNKPASAELGYEIQDVTARPVAYALLAFVLITAVALLIMALMFNILAERRAPVAILGSAAVQPQVVPPGPRLEVSSRAELDALRAIEEEALHSYGWVDREAGIVRVPITRAMELLLEQGLPVREDPPASEDGG